MACSPPMEEDTACSPAAADERLAERAPACSPPGPERPAELASACLPRPHLGGPGRARVACWPVAADDLAEGLVAWGARWRYRAWPARARIPATATATTARPGGSSPRPHHRGGTLRTARSPWPWCRLPRVRGGGGLERGQVVEHHGHRPHDDEPAEGVPHRGDDGGRWRNR